MPNAVMFLEGGSVWDGSGGPAFAADVLIRENRKTIPPRRVLHRIAKPGDTLDHFDRARVMEGA